MENWIMMLTNKVKKIMSKQTEHDGRFDAIDTALANASVQGVLDLIGTSADTGDTTVMGKINSSVNKIIHPSFENIYMPSDTVIATLFSEEVTIKASSIRVVNPITVNCNGLIKVKASIKTGDASSYSDAGLDIYKYYKGCGNVEKFDLKISGKLDYVTASTDIVVSEGDILYIDFWHGSNGTGGCNSITLCGSQTGVPTI